MPACTFFGHREGGDLEEEKLEKALRELIEKGVDRFYVGHQGEFDSKVFECLKKLKRCYPHVFVFVVLAYLPRKGGEYDVYDGYSLYPEGLERVPPKFAIAERNKWMIAKSDFCICRVDYPFGGAFQFASLAKRKGLGVINLGKLSWEGGIHS